MMAKPTCTLEEVRGEYLKVFHRGLADLKKEGRECFSKICIRLNSQRPQELYQLWVVDALEKKPDGSTGAIEFNIDPIEAIIPGSDGTRPIMWNSITFSCARAKFVEDDLLAWCERWIHDESPPFGEQDGLTGIIHSVTAPEISGDLVTISVDFGSAPLQAINELLETLGSSLESVASVTVAG